MITALAKRSSPLADFLDRTGCVAYIRPVLPSLAMGCVVDRRLWIATVLVLCGTICLLAVLGIVAFICYQVFQRGGDVGSGFRGVGDWVITLLVLFGVVGAAIVGIGVLVGIRR
jgi:hypothetical protein